MSSPFLILLSDTEQDQAACEKWWRETSTEDKIRVWDRIQVSYPDDPWMETVTRFAQLKFSEMALKYGE